MKKLKIGVIGKDENPNELVGLQANHKYKKIVTEDGEKEWVWKPNNNKGEKWEEINSKICYNEEEKKIGCVRFSECSKPLYSKFKYSVNGNENLQIENLDRIIRIDVLAFNLGTTKTASIEKNGDTIQFISPFTDNTHTDYKVYIEYTKTNDEQICDNQEYEGQ